jgi:phosphatidylserine/phosphatidylglycerophosphate/cardiolipin synthase-like enzyme
MMLYKNENEIYKIGGKSIQEDLQLKPVFEKIEKEIIEHIKTSKYSVWVAVAWITSKPIAEALYRQHQKGGNIRIIVNDDSLTESRGIPESSNCSMASAAF